MSTIILHNESENQLNLIENLLKELKIKFEVYEKSDEFTDWQKKLIDEGLKDFEEGNFSTSEDVHKGARLCLK